MGEQLYTVKDAAALLNVTPQSVYNWINLGLLAAQRVGKRNLRIREQDLANFVVPAV